jgi:hypothetical protein
MPACCRPDRTTARVRGSLGFCDPDVTPAGGGEGPVFGQNIGFCWTFLIGARRLCSSCTDWWKPASSTLMAFTTRADRTTAY